MESGQVLDATIAQNETQARALWALRENHSEAQKREGPSIKHDISVAVSKLPTFMHEGLAAMKKALPECRPVPFGHVGDGNLHFNCQSPPGWDKPRFMAYHEAISGAVYDLVVGHGGSISAEHGIGLLKVDELAHYRTKIELDAMRAIKRALDPQNIMNPGKVIRI
jgi:FAD/FMN-containing dehydrogenase